jgi:hypothetical protein
MQRKVDVLDETKILVMVNISNGRSFEKFQKRRPTILPSRISMHGVEMADFTR